MHRTIIKKTIKATIINIIVALCITTAIVLFIYLFLGAKIDETISIVSKIATDKENKQVLETILTEEHRNRKLSRIWYTIRNNRNT